MSTLSLRAVACVCSALLAAACSSFTPIVKHEPGTTYGQIFLSAPRVSSRQRLIEDRIAQDRWLKKRLDLTDDLEFGNQGKVDIRSAATLALGGTLLSDPTEGRTFEQSRQNQLDEAKRENELRSLQFDIEKARLRALLEQAQKETDPSKITSPYADASAAKAPKAGEVNRPTFDNRFADTMLKLEDRLRSAEKTPLPKGSPADTSAKPSPIDDFRDRLAYREEVRNEIIQNLLDDRHDIGGNAIYRLNFDASILPANDTSAWAYIGVCLARAGSDPGACGKASLLLGKEVDDFAREFEKRWVLELAARVSEIERHIGDQPSEQAWQKLQRRTRAIVLSANRALQVQTPVGNSKLPTLVFSASQATRSSTRSNQGRLFGGSFDPDKMPSNANRLCGNVAKSDSEGTLVISKTGVQPVGRLKNALHFTTNQRTCKYSDLLRGLLEVGLANAYLEELDEALEGVDRKAKSKEGLGSVVFEQGRVTFDSPILGILGTTRLDLYAYAGTPRELVQRVSDVAGRSQNQEFLLALQALRGGGNLSAFMSFAKANEGLFHAIRRQPLVVGFGSLGAQHIVGESPIGASLAADFGWIIGPRFAIKNDGRSTQFRHQVVQEGLSAVVSVPSWWDEVDIIVTRRWIHESTAEPLESGPMKLPNLKYTVRLPATPDGILSLFRSGQRQLPDELPETEANWRLKVGSPAKLVIRGKELWRNAKVMLGGQVADDVTLLPNMGGIVAHFDKVASIGGGPAPAVGARKGIPVSIATSAGYDIVGYAEITDEKPAQQPVNASAPPFVVAGQNNRITLPQPLPGYYSLSSRFREAETRKKFSTPVANVDSINEKVVVYRGDYKKGMGPASGDLVELQLEVVARKGEDPQVIALQRPVVYYASAGSAKLVATLEAGPAPKRPEATLGIRFPSSIEKALTFANDMPTFRAVDESADKLTLTAGALSCEKPGPPWKDCRLAVSWDDESGAKRPRIKLHLENLPKGLPLDPSPPAVDTRPAESKKKAAPGKPDKTTG